MRRHSGRCFALPQRTERCKLSGSLYIKSSYSSSSSSPTCKAPSLHTSSILSLNGHSMNTTSRRHYAARRSRAATAAAKKKPEELDRIEELRTLLRSYSDEYYNIGTSPVSDSEYDALFRELQDLEEKFPEYTTSDSPTQTVGAPISKEESLKHRNPMLSLTNAYDFEELSKFDQRAKGVLRAGQSVQYVCELKYDGVAVSLHYSGGKFVRALTRGDGKVGEDITSNILSYVKNIPKRIDLKLLPEPLRTGDFEVRGEVVMRKQEFERLNQLQEQGNNRVYSNARNLVAGLLNRKLEQSKSKQAISLDIVAYYFQENLEEGDLGLEAHWDRLTMIKGFGFQPDPCAVLCPSIRSVMKFITEWDISKSEDSRQANKRENYGYGIDGIVIKVNSLEQQTALGTTNRVPRWAVAYKFDAMKAAAKLLDIQFQVGRTGKATPVAILSPVNLAGSMVERATLHNIDYIERNGIKKGATVLVEKGGDVIPKISGVVSADGDSGVEDHPDWSAMVCPCKFKSPLVARPDGVDIFCEHPSCPEQMVRSLEHFAGRDCMKITGLGENSLRTLMEEGYLSDLPSIFRLKDHRAALCSMHGWGTKKVDSLLASVADCKSRANFGLVLYGLGIPHVGKQTAEVLAEHYKTFDQLIDATLTSNGVVYIRGMGYAVGEALVSFFSSEANRDMVLQLCAELDLSDTPESEEPKELVSEAYVDQTVMFTGSLTSMTREAAGQKVKERGGSVGNTLSKSITLLVCGDKASPQKLDKAAKLGIKMISEEEFNASL